MYPVPLDLETEDALSISNAFCVLEQYSLYYSGINEDKDAVTTS